MECPPDLLPQGAQVKCLLFQEAFWDCCGQVPFSRSPDQCSFHSPDDCTPQFSQHSPGVRSCPSRISNSIPFTVYNSPVRCGAVGRPGRPPCSLVCPLSQDVLVIGAGPSSLGESGLWRRSEPQFWEDPEAGAGAQCRRAYGRGRRRPSRALTPHSRPHLPPQFPDPPHCPSLGTRSPTSSMSLPLGSDPSSTPTRLVA